VRIKNVLQYLEETAARLPDKIAFSDGEGGASLTFSALLDAAKRIGSGLCRVGLAGKRVAVLMERHPAAIAAMLGATYAGAIYVPLDATMPSERIAQILSGCRASGLVCDEKNHATAASFDLPTMLCESLAEQEIDHAALHAVRTRMIDTDPMYIIFTSGSTGMPKGVVGCHRAVIDYGEALTGALNLGERCVFGCQSPLYFDAPLKEILTTLMCGATTYLIPRTLFSFPVPLIDYLTRNGINTICWVSSALAHISTLGALKAKAPHTLTTVVFGSETLPVSHYRAWRDALPEATFYQLYGPTEATGMSCVWRADRELGGDESIPIGKPLDNTDLILLNDAGERIFFESGRMSEVGEIYLRGSCLTLGYDHNDDATSCAFVQNPLHKAYTETVYRTGDLARYNERGELIFLGRRDGQIKRMGHRIETAEIESCANSCEGVDGAVCLVTDRNTLTLYYTGDAPEERVVDKLRARLPRYYLPSCVKKMTSFPRMENGKVDRRALREE
jgi:amino acid adenylation domain-containing protein